MTLVAMHRPSAVVEVVEVVDAAQARLRVAGDVDVRSTGELRERVYALLLRAPRGSTVVVDLAQVASIDATALRVLAVASSFARRRDVRLVLAGAGPTVRRMLHLTRLIRVVELERESVAV